AGKATALDGADDVILLNAVSDLKRLVDDETQGRTGEIHVLVAAVDGDFARTWLQPDACNSVLAAASCIGAALCVDFLLTQWRGRTRAHNHRGFGRFVGRDAAGRGAAGKGAEVGEIGDGVIRHQAPTLFLRLRPATSNSSGCV